MSSVAPPSSINSMETKVGIPDDINEYNERVASEWVYCMKGNEEEFHKYYHNQREDKRMEKVPRSLLKTDKNRDYYKPAVVSLGPYHHNHPDLAEAENYKLITLHEYRLLTKKSIDELYNMVFQVLHDARKCYIDGSTDAYNDEEFNLMMLRDACFILFFIECVSDGSIKMTLPNEHLGSIEFINIVRDIFLLENQIPFVVLDVLLKLRFPNDNGKSILTGFFNLLNHGSIETKRDDKKMLRYKQPLHLLELYRSYFISLPTSNRFRKPDYNIWSVEEDYDEHNYVKQSRGFGSATELKAKWIYLEELSTIEDDHDMMFNKICWYGVFKFACRAVSSYTKAIYMNMIAYEMCPHNPNDFRVSTYVRVMKALVIQADDVKELRDKNLLIHGLRRDEEVVKMFDEIEVPEITLPIFNELRHEIAKFRKTNYKTWLRELMTDYFGSPWKTLASLVAAAILVTTIVQTYLAIKPRGGH